MKTSAMATTVLLTLLSLPGFAFERDVEIQCRLTSAQSDRVSRVHLYSATDEVKIVYRNGSTETVKPVEARNRGPFGNEDFSSDLVWSNGQIFVPKSGVGEIYVRFGCYITPTIFFERCLSQGDGKPARYAGVRMNLGGKVMAFFDRNICTRTDRGPI